MQEKFSLFEINIQHQQKGYDYFPITVEFITAGNEVATKRLGKLLLNDKIIQDLREYEDWGEPEKYGRSLGELIFIEAIRDALNQAGTQLRVFLSVDAPELRGLRWERLATPAEDKWQMLARNENTPFAISLASQRYVSFPPLQPKEIKALVVVAHPNDIEAHGFSSFDANKAIKDSIVALSKITAEIDVLAIDAQSSINEALGEIDQELRETEESNTRQTAVKQIGEPTEASLSSALTTKQYSILHLVAHGNFVAQQDQEETYVYLGNESNETVAVSATKIISLLHDKQNLPRFAFLVSCDSGRQRRLIEAGANSAREGLGQRLVQEAGLHAVVAMTDEITIASAEQLAPTFYERLSEHGYPDLALVQAGAALRNRRDITEIVPVLFSRLRGRPLYYQPFTEAAGIPLTETEIEAGYKHLHQLIRERAPRVLKDFIEKDSDGKRDSDALFKLKQAFRSVKPNWSELTNLVSDWSVIEWLNNLCYNLLDFDFVELAKGREVPNYAVECPFPGLKAFGIPTQDDREGRKSRPYFFGRDKQIDVILKKIKKNPVLLVTGASGSGKSSIVMAGVIPQLENEGLKWEYMTPGDNPTSVLQRKLDSNPDILVVDQLEEIFTHVYQDKQGENTREQFIENLANWLEEKAQNRKLLLTMRSDFESDCSSIEKLADWVRDYSQTVLPLTSVELQDVVLQQAANAFPTKNEDSGETVPLGLKFDPGLLNTIMSDLHGETGVMPLLQFTLHALWERRQGRWLRANAYAELGGIDQAIAHTAEEIYQNLNNEEQALMKYIFIRLTHLDESGGRGQQRRDTRHRVALKDLLPKGKTLEQVADLVFDESMRGLLVTSQPENIETKGDSHTSIDEQHNQEYTVAKYTQVEVIHEAVIRHWRRLQDWLDSDYEMLRQRQKIQQEALDWHNEPDVEKQRSLLLLHGARLQEIKTWLAHQELDLNVSEEAYVETCDIKERAQQRQRLTLISGAFVILLIFLGIASYFWYVSAEAEEETRNTLAIVLANESHSVKDYETSLLLAIESIQLTDNSIQKVQEALSEALATSPFAITHTVEDYNIVSFDFSVNGKRMITSEGGVLDKNNDNYVLLWDGENGQLINKLMPELPEGESLTDFRATFNNSGSRIVTHFFSQEYPVDYTRFDLWDAETGDLIAAMTNEGVCMEKTIPSNIRINFSADDSLIWINGHRHVFVWDGITGDCKFKEEILPGSNAAFSVEGNYFSIVTPDGNIKIWDFQSETVDEIEGDFQNAIDFSLNSEWLLVDYPYSLLQVNGDRSIPFSTGTFGATFIGEGEQLLVTYSLNKRHAYRIWDTATLTFTQSISNSILEKVVYESNTNSISHLLFYDQSVKESRIWTFARGEIEEKNFPIPPYILGDFFSGPFFIISDDFRYFIGNDLHLWDISLDKRVVDLNRENGTIKDAYFSPSGQYLLLVREDKSELIETKTGRTLRLLPNIVNYEFHADEELLLGVNRNIHTAKLFRYSLLDREYAAQTHIYNLIEDQFLRSVIGSNVTVNPNGSVLVSKTSNGNVAFWNPDTIGPNAQEIAQGIEKEGLQLQPSISISSDGSTLILSGNYLGAWNTDNYETTFLRPAVGPTRYISQIYGRREDLIAVLDNDGEYVLRAIVYDQEDVETMQLINLTADKILETSSSNIFFSPNLKWAFTRDRDNGNIYNNWNLNATGIINVITGEAIWLPPEASELKNSVGWNEDYPILATILPEGNVEIWDLASRSILARIMPEKGIEAVLFTPDGRRIFTWDKANEIELWDAKTGQNISTVDNFILPNNMSIGVNFLVSNTDGSRFVTGNTLYQISPTLWRDDGSFIDVLKHSGNGIDSESVIFNAAGDRLLTRFGPDQVRLIDSTDGSDKSIFYQPNIIDQFFSQNGEVVFLVSPNRVTAWHSSNGEFMYSSTFPQRILQASVFPDNSNLVIYTETGQLLVWTVSESELIAPACEIAGRNFTYNEWLQYFGMQPYRKTCANWPVHSSVFEAAADLIKRDQIDEADILYDNIMMLEPEFGQAEAEMAKSIAMAEKFVQEAEDFLSIDISIALEKYENAIELVPDISADSTFLANICFQGAIQGITLKLHDPCDLAVSENNLAVSENTTKPDSLYKSLIGRAIVLAQAGDFDSSIDDLQTYLSLEAHAREFYFESQIGLNDAKIQEWIRQLDNNQNPFNESTLNQLYQRINEPS